MPAVHQKGGKQVEHRQAVVAALEDEEGNMGIAVKEAEHLVDDVDAVGVQMS